MRLSTWLALAATTFLKVDDLYEPEATSDRCRQPRPRSGLGQFRSAWTPFRAKPERIAARDEPTLTAASPAPAPRKQEANKIQ